MINERMSPQIKQEYQPIDTWKKSYPCGIALLISSGRERNNRKSRELGRLPVGNARPK